MQELPYFFPISQHSTLNYRRSAPIYSPKGDLPSTGEATSRTAALPRLEQHLQVRLEQLAPRALEL